MDKEQKWRDEFNKEFKKSPYIHAIGELTIFHGVPFKSELFDYYVKACKKRDAEIESLKSKLADYEEALKYLELVDGVGEFSGFSNQDEWNEFYAFVDKLKGKEQ